MTTDLVVAIFTGIQTIAVVSGLLFVSLQLRDARRIARGGAYQAWLDTMVQFFQSLGEVEGLSDLYWRGRKDIGSLTETEIPRFFYLCVTYFTLIENLYVQYDQGLIPEDAFLPWQHGLTEGLTGSGFAEYWRLEAAHFAPSFRTFVDSLLSAELGPASDSKMSAFWSLVNNNHSEPS